MISKHNFTLPTHQLKATNLDFLVDEIYLKPKLVSIDKASYTYLYVQKENLTTFQLLQILADYFQLDAQAVAASGLKDEQAITQQIISVGTIISAEQVNLANAFFQNEGIVISIVHIIGYGQQPVYPRKLHGNNFTITIRNLDETVAQQVEQFLQTNRFFTLINYYDEQRFGVPYSIHNTHRIGQELLMDNWQAAYQEYIKSGNDPAETDRVKAIVLQKQAYDEAMQTIMPNKLNFFVASYNSYLWNNKLKEIIIRFTEAVQVEIPYLDVISLPQIKQTTLLPPILSMEVEQKDWQTGQNTSKIKQRPIVLNIPIYLINKKTDILNPPDKQAITVSFYLPTGCYATMLVKQLLLAALTVND